MFTTYSDTWHEVRWSSLKRNALSMVFESPGQLNSACIKSGNPPPQYTWSQKFALGWGPSTTQSLSYSPLLTRWGHLCHNCAPHACQRTERFLPYSHANFRPQLDPVIIRIGPYGISPSQSTASPQINLIKDELFPCLLLTWIETAPGNSV